MLRVALTVSRVASTVLPVAESLSGGDAGLVVEVPVMGAGVVGPSTPPPLLHRSRRGKRQEEQAGQGHDNGDECFAHLISQALVTRDRTRAKDRTQASYQVPIACQAPVSTDSGTLIAQTRKGRRA